MQALVCDRLNGDFQRQYFVKASSPSIRKGAITLWPLLQRPGRFSGPGAVRRSGWRRAGPERARIWPPARSSRSHCAEGQMVAGGQRLRLHEPGQRLRPGVDGRRDVRETAAVFVQQTVRSTFRVCPKDTPLPAGRRARVMTMTSDALTPTDTGLTVRLWALFAVGDDGVPEGGACRRAGWVLLGLPAPAAPGESQTVTLADASQLTFSRWPVHRCDLARFLSSPVHEPLVTSHERRNESAQSHGIATGGMFTLTVNMHTTTSLA